MEVQQMHHRGFFFPRLLVFALLIGGLLFIGSSVYRAGYAEGFSQAAVLGSLPDGAAAYGVGLRPHGFGFFPLLFCLLPLGFLTLMALGGRRWACGRGHGRMGRGPGGHWDGPPRPHRRGDDDDYVGPEKQPEDFV
jgi:hypothetical protein